MLTASHPQRGPWRCGRPLQAQHQDRRPAFLPAGSLPGQPLQPQGLPQTELPVAVCLPQADPSIGHQGPRNIWNPLTKPPPKFPNLGCWSLGSYTPWSPGPRPQASVSPLGTLRPASPGCPKARLTWVLRLSVFPLVAAVHLHRTSVVFFLGQT